MGNKFSESSEVSGKLDDNLNEFNISGEESNDHENEKKYEVESSPPSSKSVPKNRQNSSENGEKGDLKTLGEVEQSLQNLQEEVGSLVIVFHELKSERINAQEGVDSIKKSINKLKQIDYFVRRYFKREMKNKDMWPLEDQIRFQELARLFKRQREKSQKWLLNEEIIEIYEQGKTNLVKRIEERKRKEEEKRKNKEFLERMKRNKQKQKQKQQVEEEEEDGDQWIEEDLDLQKVEQDYEKKQRYVLSKEQAETIETIEKIEKEKRERLQHLVGEMNELVDMMNDAKEIIGSQSPLLHKMQDHVENSIIKVERGRKQVKIAKKVQDLKRDVTQKVVGVGVKSAVMVGKEGTSLFVKTLL